MPHQHINKERNVTIQKAKKLALNYEVSEVITIIDQYLDKDPNDADILVLKGNILEMTESVEDAKSLYGKALLVDPTNCKALVDMGDAYNADNDHSVAIDYYTQALNVLKKDVLSDSTPWDKEDLEVSAYKGAIESMLSLKDQERAKKNQWGQILS